LLELPLEESPDELVLEVISVMDADEIESRNRLWWWQPGAGEFHDLPLEPETEFTLSLDPGLYVLSTFVRCSERGDVNYGFLIWVEEQAAPAKICGQARTGHRNLTHSPAPV
jgi:hypothetical protein